MAHHKRAAHKRAVPRRWSKVSTKPSNRIVKYSRTKFHTEQHVCVRVSVNSYRLPMKAISWKLNNVIVKAQRWKSKMSLICYTCTWICWELVNTISVHEMQTPCFPFSNTYTILKLLWIESISWNVFFFEILYWTWKISRNSVEKLWRISFDFFLLFSNPLYIILHYWLLFYIAIFAVCVAQHLKYYIWI